MAAMVAKKQLAVTKRLGRELLESRGNVNNAAVLLATLTQSLHHDASNASAQVLTEALLSLEAFFLPLVKSGEFSPSAQKKASDVLQSSRGKRGRDGEGKGEGGGGSEDDMAKADAICKKWVWDRYREFVTTLLRFVARHNAMPEVQTAALHAIMELVRSEVQGEFNNRLYMKLCSTLVCSKAFNSNLLSVIASDYFKYLDVCFYTYSNMERITERRLSKKATGSETISSDDEDDSNRNFTSVFSMVRNMYDLLINLPPLSQESLSELWSSSSASEDGIMTDGQKTSDETSEPCKDQKKQRQRVNKAWLAFLRLPLSFDIYKKVLAQLHKRVIPLLSNPILLSDFLTNSYNQGGLISVMALNGLYILINLHGLEYPDFFNKLYALLEPSIFVAKHRARFFELTDTCLKLDTIPAYFAAAFAKKLSRLALSAPPSGALVVIALIHNLLRRHPSINHLVHRDASSTTTSDSEAKRGADPFLEFEADTAKCHALESSLWEVDTLRNHYCPAVSRFVASLETDLTVRSKTTEVNIADFNSGSYTTIFTEEVSKRLKAVPLAFYQTVPCSLFSEKTEDFVGWRFGDSPSVFQHTEEQSSKSLSVGLDEKSSQAVAYNASIGTDTESKEENFFPLPKKKKHSKDDEASKIFFNGADKKKGKAAVSKGSVGIASEEGKIVPLSKQKRK